MNTETSIPSETDQYDNELCPTIMQVLPQLITGGVEQGTVDVAIAIAETGGKSIVVSAGGPMTQELVRNGVKHFELPLTSKNPITMRKNARKLLNIIHEEEADIMHARSRAPAWSAWHAATKAKVPFITTFHGTYGHTNWFKRRYNQVMIRGDRIIAISDFIAGHILRNYGVPAAKINVIPRGIDIEKFSPSNVSQERRIKLANEWRLPDDKKIIILPGRLTRWKGQKVFVEAVQKLNRNDVQCLIVGSDKDRGNYRNELQNHIEHLGLQNIIHLVGHCNDMPAAYMLTDIVVSASTDPEAFGRIAVEGQSLGRLVIATNHGGSRETIIDGETGWLVEPNNPNKLAEIMDTVLDINNHQRTEYTENARNHVQGLYSKNTMCAKTLEVYKELIRSNTNKS